MFAAIPRQIAGRIGILFALLAAFLVAALFSLNLIERYSVHEILADESAEHSRMLDSFLTLQGKSLRLFVTSYARRTNFTRPDEEHRAASADSTLQTGLRTFDVSAAWVMEADGAVRLHATADGIPPQPPPVTPSQLMQLKSPRVHFFLNRLGTVYEVRGARLAVSGSNPSTPRGWLFAALRFDEAAMTTTNMPVAGKLSFIPPNKAGQPPPHRHLVRIERLVHDFAGEPIMALRLDYQPSEIELVLLLGRLNLAVMICFSLAALCLCALCLWRWVVLPIGTLRSSLTEKNPHSLAPLVSAGGEFGTIASLVQDSLIARRQADQALEERTRLTRSLHDGVIQTLYAASMNLAGARPHLPPSSPGVERLDRTSAALNATVVDVRNFILGLEPETLTKRTLRENVDLILSMLRPLRAIEFHVEIDDHLAERLSPDQRALSLQLIREALTHNLHRSAATYVTIRVRPQAAEVFIEVEDDADGADPVRVNENLRSFKDLIGRVADISGAVSVEPITPKGTRARLAFPLTPSR